jgi:TrmH family RNA methyltransferase
LAQISRLRKLKQRKYRWLEKQFLLEGERGCRQVLEFTPDGLEYVVLREDVANAPPAHCPVFTISTEGMRDLTETETPPAWLGLCRMPAPAVPAKAKGAVVVCDAIQDPGNLGTILRTASWFGCNTVLLGKGTADPYQPKVVRATAGGIMTLQIAEVDLPSGLDPWLVAGYTPLVLDASPDALTAGDAQLPSKTLFIAGNEGNGLSSAVLSSSWNRFAIPGAGSLESLNVAVATSIALFAWHNQHPTSTLNA